VANVYVDLTATGASYAGTPSDPYSYEDWDNNVSAGNTYYIRGSISPVTDFSHDGVSFNIRAWDLNTYGPWRLNFGSNNFSAGDANAYDGILYASNVRISILDTTYLKYSGTTVNLFGDILNSTVVMESATATINNVITVDQSVFKANGYSIDCLLTATISNLMTDRSSGLFTSSVSYGSNLNYSQILSEEPSDAFQSESEYNLKATYGVGSIGSWAYMDAGYNIQQYNPITMALTQDYVTGIDFGNVIQGNHCSRSVVIKPGPHKGYEFNNLAMILEDDAGLSNSDFGHFISKMPFTNIGPGSTYLSDNFSGLPGVSDYAGFLLTSDAGIILDPEDPEYIWLDINVGSGETLGQSDINYRFLFEYS